MSQRSLGQSLTGTLAVLVSVALAEPPNDPDFLNGLQWGLVNSGQTILKQPGVVGADIDVLGAWDVHTGISSVLVAIVGRGVDPHPEFADRLLEGRAFVGDLFNTLDTCPHDTQLAGLIAAATDNGLGIAGINGQARLLPVRVFDGCSGSPAATAKGMIWAVDQGADIILVAVQFETSTAALEGAVNYAVARDVMVIAPAGSAGNMAVNYPAAIDGCLAVAATTNEDLISPSSNQGPEVDLAAPGTAIWSTWVEDGYRYLGVETDTAAASALVAGVASLVRSYAPQLSAVEVKQLLIESTDDLGEPGWDPHFGAGRLNSAQALTLAPPPALRFEPVEPFPRMIVPGATTSFVVRIVAVAETLSPGSAWLHYRDVEEAGAFSIAPLTPLGDDLFLAALPAAVCRSSMAYYLSATGDGSTKVTTPLTAPDELYTAEAAIIGTLFSDDFETDLSWDVVGGDNLTGRWDRVVPVANAAQPGFDHSPGEGQFCFVTGQHFGGQDGSNDVDGGPVTLTSPLVELPADSDAVEVSYARWFQSTLGTPDQLTVDVSRDGGDHWTTIEIVESSPGWTWHGVSLGDFPEAVGNRLLVRFSTADLGEPSLTEAAIDDFQVRVVLCSPRLGDTNGDDAIDLDDYRRMSACWSGPDDMVSRAGCDVVDFNADRRVDLTDFGRFQERFAPGK